MRKARLLFICGLIALCGFVLSCEDEEKDEIKINITCSGTTSYDNSFTAYYYLNDSDEPEEFEINAKSSTLYYCSETFDDLDYIYVEASRSDYHNTLTIKIARDGDWLTDYTTSIDSSDTSSFNIDLEYTYDEENDDDE